MSCDSWDSNAEFDLVPIPQSGDHLNPILCYLGPEGMVKHLTHPYASPLFGAMEGLPPLLIQTGDAEVLLDESMLLAHKASLAGVNVRHEIYEDQVRFSSSLGSDLLSVHAGTCLPNDILPRSRRKSNVVLW
jgi:acetyl esterase/lipase